VQWPAPSVPDPVPQRREQALRFGATHTISPDALTETVQTLSDDGKVDVVIELSGKTAALDAAWPLLRMGGTLVLVGAVFPDAPVSWVPEQIVRRHLTIRGIHNYAPRHLRSAVQFLAEHHESAPFAELVSNWYPLRDIREAFAAGAKSGAIRVGVKP
jgi:threonine dehydrogenase-like Zn-dependent dehydrogenase